MKTEDRVVFLFCFFSKKSQPPTPTSNKMVGALIISRGILCKAKLTMKLNLYVYVKKTSRNVKVYYPYFTNEWKFSSFSNCIV